MKKFNFEISLIDILCYDEINIIAQVDKDRNIKRMHRNKCSWEGYKKLYEGFENWIRCICQFDDQILIVGSDKTITILKNKEIKAILSEHNNDVRNICKIIW